MLIVNPDSWPQPSPLGIPMCLLSGNRMVYLRSIPSVYALQRAGIPTAVLSQVDYVRFLKLYPGPDGAPTHAIPPEIDTL